ncbi:HPr family phosphocarrier protein [Olsenella sp. YH-ols2217]|uniref:Phosphocarrier protein HPr n=1 Tax=Kribbibacterium absianum TaxID=3044210 RepID=A0ABT6ZKC0_9ACTN|nr:MULTISPECIES: HPr family phosphocarrier protein [unclassified Olsenella]MDJ1122663.1 HPr family phosphocarrier protein [Olsenella sp. YH-ols2216]MDJ1129101.1 HPr family phosphocarrier protein [Olsenella sp. YH-ols2217]
MVYSKKTIVVNPTGIHARPASTFVMKAREYESEVLVRNVTKDGAYVSAVSIMSVMAQGLSCGTEIEVAAEGPDEQAAVDGLIELVDSGFGE